MTNKIRMLFRSLRGFIVLTTLTIVSVSQADVSWSDSAVFSVDLRTIRTSWRSCRSGDSGGFGVNLYPVRRAAGDSASFAYDCLANTSPTAGLRLPPALISYDGLLQFNGVEWITPFSVPGDGDAVVVLNHGWNSWPEDFTPLAQVIKTRDSSIYVYSWRWGYGEHVPSDANPNGYSSLIDFAPLATCSIKPYLCWWGAPATINEIQGAMSKSFNHGRKLGDALFGIGIRPDKQYIHMVGHSFGGIVSSEAAVVLKNRTGTKIHQLTTLETPGIPGIANAVNYLKVDRAERTEIIYYDNADNIIRGATGWPYPYSAPYLLNFKLHPSNMNTGLLHSRIIDWYVDSAAASAFNCDGAPYGFGWSVSLHRDPDWKLGLPIGTQEETQIYLGCMQELSDIRRRESIKQTNSQKVAFLSAASWAGQQAQVVIDTAATELVKTAVQLKVVRGVSPQAMTTEMIAAMDEPTTNDDAYIFRTIEIPADAKQVVLDLRFAKIGQGDVLTVSIEEDNVMEIDAAAFGQLDTYTETPPAYIGDYAGQAVTLQIALRGTGAGDSEVLIEAIRFMDVTLSADVDEDGAVGLTDVIRMADYWMAIGCAAMDDCGGADVNRDGKIDMEDFAMLAENWLWQKDNVVPAEPGEE